MELETTAVNPLDIQALTSMVVRDHAVLVANPAEFSRDKARFESVHGFELPVDIQFFYRACKQANLFGSCFEMLPLSDWLPAGAAMLDDQDSLPRSWFAFCKRETNGDHIGIDLSKPDGVFPILDLDQGDLTHCSVIALGFSEFLQDVLAFGEESLYFQNDENQYGTAIGHSSSLYRRQAFAHDWECLGPEQGPECCKTHVCQKLRIPLSVFCKQHHFEQVHGFDFTNEDAEPGWTKYEKSQRWLDLNSSDIVG